MDSRLLFYVSINDDMNKFLSCFNPRWELTMLRPSAQVPFSTFRTRIPSAPVEDIWDPIIEIRYADTDHILLPAANDVCMCAFGNIVSIFLECMRLSSWAELNKWKDVWGGHFHSSWLVLKYITYLGLILLQCPQRYDGWEQMSLDIVLCMWL